MTTNPNGPSTRHLAFELRTAKMCHCPVDSSIHLAGCSGGLGFSPPSPITPPQAFIQTFTGKFINVLDLDANLIDIRDIAHSLSQQCRFNGHCSEFYSVAQHCVYVSMMLPPPWKFPGLMHDGTEAYLCDIPSPLKPHLVNYKGLELRAAKVIEEKWFGGENILEHPIVKEADTRMLATEFRDLRAHNSPVEHWTSLKGVAPYSNLVIKPWSAKKAEKKFLEAFYRLQPMQPATR